MIEILVILLEPVVVNTLFTILEAVFGNPPHKTHSEWETDN